MPGLIRDHQPRPIEVGQPHRRATDCVEQTVVDSAVARPVEVDAAATVHCVVATRRNGVRLHVRGARVPEDVRGHQLRRRRRKDEEEEIRGGQRREEDEEDEQKRDGLNELNENAPER